MCCQKRHTNKCDSASDPNVVLRLVLMVTLYGPFSILANLTSLSCLLQSSLRISPSVPFLMSSMQRDPLKLALGSRLDHSSSPLTPPPSATPSGGLSHRWPGASIWPNWDLMKTPESPFSIEREAWLHRQAACMACCILL